VAAQVLPVILLVKYYTGVAAGAVAHILMMLAVVLAELAVAEEDLHTMYQTGGQVLVMVLVAAKLLTVVAIQLTATAMHDTAAMAQPILAVVVAMVDHITVPVDLALSL
jgi:hypothetical protein